MLIFLSISFAETITGDLFTAQEKSIKLIQKYIATADWKLRAEIMKASGLSETVASRIFRGFEVVSINAKPCDEYEIVNAAHEELNRNPQYTLYLLEPLLREKMSKQEEAEYGGASFPPVRPEHIELFFNICADFALSPNGDFAIKKLQSLTKDPDKSISQKAENILAYCQKKKASGTVKNKSGRSKCFQDWLWK